jgi:hypothetical protein
MRNDHPIISTTRGGSFDDLFRLDQYSMFDVKIVLQRREFFHYPLFLQQISDAFSPPTSRVLSTMQELLLRYGYGPAEVLTKGKSLLALWVHR